MHWVPFSCYRGLMSGYFECCFFAIVLAQTWLLYVVEVPHVRGRSNIPTREIGMHRLPFQSEDSLRPSVLFSRCTSLRAFAMQVSAIVVLEGERSLGTRIVNHKG